MTYHIQSSLFPLCTFHDGASSWTRNCTGRRGEFAATAAFRDLAALKASAPRRLRNLLPSTSPHSATIIRSVTDTLEFVQGELLPRVRDKIKRDRLVSSLYAGGVDYDDFLGSLDNSEPALNNIGLGILNPGRLGLSTMNAEHVLWCRL